MRSYTHATTSWTNLPSLEDVGLLGVAGKVGDDQVSQRKTLQTNDLTVDTLSVSGTVAGGIIARAVNKDLTGYGRQI